MMFCAVHIVPTGVKAAIGGYEGDATPATNVLASVCDKIIVHPNVVNGVSLNLASANALYVEGYSLDSFLQGKLALRESLGNKIGVILDRGMDKSGHDLAINTINAIRSVKGANILGYHVTHKSIGARAIKTQQGAFAGQVDDEKTLLDAARHMLKEGADSLAICAHIDVSMKDLSLYFKGKLPNPYGGTEAILSHLISREFMIPCAHAPIVSKKEIKKELFSGIIDARAGAEAMGPAYLGCVLQGLSRAPRLVPMHLASANDITVHSLGAIVLPYSCMGGIPALAAQKLGIPLIAVKENKTVMNVTPKHLRMKNIFVAENYWEAAGILASIRQGIDPYELRRPLKALARL